MERMGDRILRLMKENEYTQKELACMVGVTESAMSRYLNNEREPKAEVIANLATALNTTSDYLISGKESDEDFAEIYPEITVEEIGYRSYELYRGEEFVGVVTPCRDTVIVASVAVESVGYDKIVDKITEIIG